MTDPIDTKAMQEAVESVLTADSHWTAQEYGNFQIIAEAMDDDYGYSICEVDAGALTGDYVRYLLAVQPRAIRALLDRLEAAEAVLSDADTSFGYVGFRSPGAVVLERYLTWQRLARGEG